MLSQPETYLTPDEYLTIERKAAYKSEYSDGEMFAMAGASSRHNLIASNIIRELSLQLKSRSCEVYSGDMRVRVSDAGLYTYPDIAVMCGDPQFDDEELDTLLNPIVIVEVMSDSTQKYDRGEKFALYKALESLKEYLLVAQNSSLVEHYVRQPDNRWVFSETKKMEDSVDLPSILCSLALTEIYDKILMM